MKLSLTKKFTIGFLLVALVAALLMALSIRWFSVEAMSRLLLEQDRNILIEDLQDYYATQGGWVGVPDYFVQRSGFLPPNNQPPQNQNGQGNRPPRPQGQNQGQGQGQGNRPPREDRATFGLANDQGRVIVHVGKYNPDQQLSEGDLNQDGTPIELDGVVIGYVLTTNNEGIALTPEEENFIRFTNWALLAATAVSVMLALILGYVLTRTLTRPVKDLTSATQAIAEGELGQQVPVRSKDELGELTETFNQMSADLAFATEARKQMTADIAHDLRSPLTVLSGYLESMEDGVLQPTPERLAAMHDEVSHLQHLVTDLRTLSLADAGELKLNLQPVDVQRLLRKTAVSFQHQAQIQEIDLSVKKADNLPKINGDEARLTQLINNLVTNALRHTKENGRIQLSASPQQNNIQIRIADNGEGISAEDLPHIFDRFYRGDKSRHSEQSGMGLAIAKSIVDAHNGKIWADSKRGQGTIFFIQLSTV